MAFGIKKFRVRASVMRRRDGSVSKVSIIPTRRIKGAREDELAKELKRKKDKERKARQAKQLKRKIRAPRS